MNFAHIHLIINHIPLITVPMALIFLIYGMITHSHQLQRFSLLVLVATAATVIPVYLTGEPTEEIVEDFSGVSESLIKEHEEAAEFAMITTLIAGALALGTILLSKHSLVQKFGAKAVVAASVIAILSLGYASNLGGHIRHPQESGIAPMSQQIHGEQLHGEQSEDDDND